MSHKRYNKEQIQELEWNKYVQSCSEKYISFTDEFKLLCIEQDTLWEYHRDVFSLCGFPTYIIESKVPSMCLKRWKSLVRSSWESWLVWNKKGRPKTEKLDTSKMSKDEYIQYLEAQVASMSEVQKYMKRWKYP